MLAISGWTTQNQSVEMYRELFLESKITPAAAAARTNKYFFLYICGSKPLSPGLLA
jgi:hypothetical protein